jgi:hypothetical protein
MAIGDSYALPAALAARLGQADDGSYAVILDAASRFVEAFTGRQFNKTDTASVRRFRALDPERLPVDDFHSLTDLAVVVDGSTWASTAVDPRPWDGVVNGQPGWPYSDLFAVGRSWPIRRRATVRVTARWGWADVPAGIVEATLGVAKAIADSAGVSGRAGVLRSETIDGYAYSLQVQDLGTIAGVPAALASAVQYRRKRFGVA